MAEFPRIPQNTCERATEIANQEWRKRSPADCADATTHSSMLRRALGLVPGFGFGFAQVSAAAAAPRMSRDDGAQYGQDAMEANGRPVDYSSIRGAGNCRQTRLVQNAMWGPNVHLMIPRHDPGTTRHDQGQTEMWTSRGSDCLLASDTALRGDQAALAGKSLVHRHSSISVRVDLW